MTRVTRAMKLKIIFLTSEDISDLEAGVCQLLYAAFFFKWAIPGLFFFYFRSIQKNETIFSTNVKNVDSVCRDEIRAHNLLNMSLLP